MTNIISTAKNNLITPIYSDSIPILFNKDGWINATDIAEQYGKRLDNWLRLEETHEYMKALDNILNPSDVRGLESVLDELIVTKRGRHGGGTWIHPKLAIAFARWLSPELAVWMDEQLLSILSGEWERERLTTTEYLNEMQEELVITREHDGKATKPFHFSNEARMINRVLTQGETDKVDRQTLTAEGLKALGKLERKNTSMIARGWSYAIRKEKLQAYLAKEFPGLSEGSIGLLMQPSTNTSVSKVA